MSVNHIVLVGYLGKAPEVLKTFDKGAFVRCSLAISKKYTGSDGQVKQDTQWHTVYVRNNRGKAAVAHLKKGSRVFVQGELRNAQWQDKEGNLHTKTAVYADEIIFLDNKLPEKVAEEPAVLLEETTINTITAAENDDVAAK